MSRTVRGRYRQHESRHARRMWCALPLVVLNTLLFGSAVVPAADAIGTSVLTISADANLPRYPCFLPQGPCQAELLGDVSGPLAGQLSDGSWSVSLLDAHVIGSFSYVHGSDCSTSAAVGSLTVLADPQGLVDGRLLSGAGPSREVTGLRLHADFSLQQAGAQTSAFLANATVELNVVGQGWVPVAAGLKGAGTTSYIPDLGTADPFDCSWVLATDPPATRVAVVGTLGVIGA